MEPALLPHAMDDTAGRDLFITGTTGFVGGALLLRLLRDNPHDRAHCLVRASSEAAAQARLEDAIRRAGAAYDLPVDDLLSRAVAVRGDLTEPGLGLDVTARERLATAGSLHVWHAAASLKDNEESLREILAHNVVGTERVLEAVLPLGVAVFNHISTAYVAGRTTGPIPEVLERPRGFANRYEQSKHYGEALVADHCNAAGVAYRILRPAIVISHSRTAGATGYNGFMGWILKVAAIAEMSQGALSRQPLRFVGQADALVNVIPIDSVVEDCSGIDAAGPATFGQVFHLTNTCCPTVQWLADVTADTLGLASMEVVADEDALDPLSQKFHRWTRFERPYVQRTRDFARASNATYDSPRHGACPLSEDALARMIHFAVADYRQHATPSASNKEVA